LGVPGSAYMAYQELERNNYWDGAGKVVMLLGCVAVVHTPFGLMGVVMVMIAAPTLVRLVNTMYFFAVEKPWLRPSWKLFDRTLLRATLGEGVCLFALQMAAIAVYQSDKLVISSVLGGEQVAGFAIIGRLFLLAYGLFSLVL